MVYFMPGALGANSLLLRWGSSLTSPSTAFNSSKSYTPRP